MEGLGDAAEVGRGGFGFVYRCYEYALERHIAVKVLTSEVSGDELEQFVREQRALGRVSGHPHILQVLYADITSTGRPFIVMPFHREGSLDRLIQTAGPLPWPRVLAIGVRLAELVSNYTPLPEIPAVARRGRTDTAGTDHRFRPVYGAGTATALPSSSTGTWARRSSRPSPRNKPRTTDICGSHEATRPLQRRLDHEVGHVTTRKSHF
ncbi:protein kinase domain-containing protein [Nocardia beijingensis]